MFDQSLRVPAQLWYSRLLQAAPSTPSPRNSPLVRAGEGPADRVLVIGNGVLHGWGVRLREMSAPGQLAQLLHDRTGRAALVEYVGEERMVAASAVDWLGTAATRGHDVAVIGVGLNDALRLTPLAAWRGQMSRLLDRVLEDQDPLARVLLVGLPHVRRFAMADSVMGSVAQRHADRMTAVLQQLADGDDRVRFVPAPQERFEVGRELGSSAMYRDWATQLLASVLPALEEVRALRPVAAEHHETWDWAGTPTALGSDGTAPQQRLEALTMAVQQRFDVALVGVNVVDGDRVYSIAGSGGAPRALPRSLAYCDLTVQQDAPTVIEDAEEHVRFAGNPFVDVVGLPFYAGVPLHAADGRPIATLCVLDDAPRADFDMAALEGFARLAERELQGFESAVPPAAEAPAPAPVAVETDSRRLRALALLLRPLIGFALHDYLRRQARPSWDDRAIVAGPEPIRVLVIGAGLAVGYGEEDGVPLPQQIAEALAAATGRGVSVETRAQASVTLEQTLALAGMAGAATFDHLVWTPTLEEATRGSARRWSRHLRRIVAALQASGPAHLQLVLMGLPLVEGAHVLQRAGRVLGRRVNTHIRAVADGSARTAYLPVPSRIIPTLDSPLFDAPYRRRVTALLVETLLASDARKPAASPAAAV